MEYTIPSIGESSNLQGVWHTDYWGGTITYEEGNYGVDISTYGSTGQRNLSGSAVYSNPSENQLQLGDIQLTEGSNIFRIVGNTLNRSGNSYNADMKVVDGNLDTSWNDFVDWHVVVTDTNDADSDGVPDFTDPPASAAPATVSLDDGWNYHVWPWVYSAADKDWLYYYCGSNGWAVWRHKDEKWYSFHASTNTWTAN